MLLLDYGNWVDSIVFGFVTWNSEKSLERETAVSVDYNIF